MGRAIFRFLNVHLGYSLGNEMKCEKIGGRETGINSIIKYTWNFTLRTVDDKTCEII